MSLKKVEQVKSDKGFRIWDLIVYGVILAIVAVLFLTVFLTQDTDPLTGVKISVKGEAVFVYDFSSEPTAKDGVEWKEEGNGITVTVRVDEGYNVIYIDKNEKSVKITDADCKGKQCLYFSAIKDNSRIIYCNPHSLKIEPLSINYSPEIPF
ncbi:MAG: hypothetical protein HDQ88_04305 [Clostridia bacterium]|nr:hypothetical protein [Clostridia bacterium]